jgi:hypothetical protein
MGDLFRVSTEVFLITTIVGLANATNMKSANDSRVNVVTNHQAPHIPQPGEGGAAVITIDASDASAGTVDVNGRSIPLEQFLRNSQHTDRVILRLKGEQWKQLTALVRNHDLPFTVETDP